MGIGLSLNWADGVVLAIILGFAIIGLISGFLYSIFKIASFFASIFIAIKFYPAISGILMKTALFTSIKTSILKNLLMQKQLTGGADSGAKQAAASSVIDKLPLPGFLRDTILKQIPDPSKFLDIQKVMDSISGELAKIVISVISLVLLYILIRIGLIFIGFILKGISKLPVFKQIDKFGGFALGAVEGLLMVFVLGAVLTLFNASPQFKSIFDAVNSSVIARFFYEHNFIINWMFSLKL